eukprot:COSAG02_NODE_1336_length_13186_cov_3.900657_5_plen_500_part_00
MADTRGLSVSPAMSSVYNSEPPTNGKVILKTSLGDVDLELWPKEAPKAVRNFVQLCLEGYYDGCSFFRLIKDLFAQTGDPSNTGHGGDSIYGGTFPDEFHSRLRFTHRGLVAMANSSEPNSNGSQFFITLSDCEWLNNKHTIFGRITGDTIYNVLQMNELEVNGEVPVYAPKIISTQVLHSPFDDIVPREIARPGQAKPKSKKSERKKLKKKNTSLLSFGEEAEEEDKELDAVLASDTSSRGVASSHDLLDDTTLLKDAADEVLNSRLREANEATEREEQRQEDAKQKLKSAAAAAASVGSDHHSVDDDVEEALAEDEDDGALETSTAQADMSFDERMRQKLKAKQATLNTAVDEQAKIDELKEKMGFKSAKGGSRGPRKGEKAARRNTSGDVDDSGKRKAEEAFMSPLEVMREKYKRKKASNTSRQQDVSHRWVVLTIGCCTFALLSHRKALNEMCVCVYVRVPDFGEASIFQEYVWRNEAGKDDRTRQLCCQLTRRG